jgi:hypothetical protein
MVEFGVSGVLFVCDMCAASPLLLLYCQSVIRDVYLYL